MAKYAVPIEFTSVQWIEVESDTFENALKYAKEHIEDVHCGINVEKVTNIGVYKENEAYVNDEEQYYKVLAVLLRSQGYGKPLKK